MTKTACAIGALLSLLLLASTAEATTYYVRTGGSTTTNCTGTTNADYPGSGTGQACAYSNLQDAIGAATFGDTIKLHAGQTFTGNFDLTNKGAAPTGTDADYITITTDDTSGIPSALSQYHNGALNLTRITTAMAANMPTVRTSNGTAVFTFKNSSKYWKLLGLNITNQDLGSSATVLMSDETTNITSMTHYPDRIWLEQNWIHPIEETGTALTGFNTTVSGCSTTQCTFASVSGLSIGNTVYLNTGPSNTGRVINNIVGNVVSWTSALPGTPADSTVASACLGNYCRTAENALYLQGTNVTVKKNACQGFVGRQKYGGEIANRLTTSCLLIGSYGDTYTIQNNLLEGWTYVIFSGGSRMPDHLVTAGGTVSGCSGSPATSCTFSTVAGLSIGDPVAVYTSTSSNTNKWGSAYISNIAGSVVTFGSGLCDPGITGGNSCSAQNGTPANGDPFRRTVRNIGGLTITRNIFNHPSEWTNLMLDGQGIHGCGGKGYFEIKDCVNCTLEGNTFLGCTFGTLTVRNQGADNPSASLSGLTFRSNYFRNSNGVLHVAGRDAGPTNKSSGITFTNNLAVGSFVHNVPSGNPGNTLSGNQTLGVAGLTITHNTILWSASSPTAFANTIGMYKGFLCFVGIANAPTTVDATVTGLVVRDNIMTLGKTAAFADTSGGSAAVTDCFPGATINTNVLYQVDAIPNCCWDQAGLNDVWFTPYPSNTQVTTAASIGFTSAPTGLDDTGNYRLLTSSAYHNAASDGTDVGVNFTTLVSALGYDPNGTPWTEQLTIGIR